MKRDGNIVSYTLDELEEMAGRGEDRTEWERVNAMTDEEIEANVDVEDEGYFDLSGARKGLPPFQEPVQVSTDIIDRLQARGINPTERINAVMKAHVEKLQAEEDARKAS